MTRARRDFIKIQSYGNIGDRKCDGLLTKDGVIRVIFQVYSPDSMRPLSTVKKKIKVDLDGAVKHWKDMSQWVFVYNSRNGLAPDIPMFLSEQQNKYPKITIDYLSNDSLWEEVRNLSPQQRYEILSSIGFSGIVLDILRVMEPDARKLLEFSHRLSSLPQKITCKDLISEAIGSILESRRKEEDLLQEIFRALEETTVLTHLPIRHSKSSTISKEGRDVGVE
jgi:hypothetical protein